MRFEDFPKPHTFKLRHTSITHEPLEDITHTFDQVEVND